MFRLRKIPKLLTNLDKIMYTLLNGKANNRQKATLGIQRPYRRFQSIDSMYCKAILQ